MILHQRGFYIEQLVSLLEEARDSSGLAFGEYCLGGALHIFSISDYGKYK